MRRVLRRVAFVGPGLVAAGLMLASTGRGGAFPGTNGRIVYVSNASGSYEIYTANPDGSAVKQLTSGGTAEHPRWSADGTKIVYQQVSGTTVSIDVMNAGGSNQHTVLSGRCSSQRG